LTLQPFVHPPQRPAATFRIFVNGKALFEETASRSDARNLEIPLADVDLQRACYLSIRIEVDRPVSPHGLGVSQDHRALGVGLIACEIAQFRKPRAALPKEARRYYFLHIPKTAGTSLNQWLTDTGEFDICPEGLWSLLLKRDRQELLSHSMYCGHFYRPLAAYLGCRLTTFTFLRNPLERAVSHHRHVLRDPHHYFHDYAARLGSFEAFARDPITRPLVDNFQVRSLSARFDPAQIAATLPPAAAEKYPPRERSRPRPPA
jgi:hypothetical protein